MIVASQTYARLAGYQILLGVGIGCVLQNTIIAVQADCEDEKQIPQRTGVVTFGQLIGESKLSRICEVS